MIITDTTIWIDHFRKPDPLLIARLRADEVLLHPLVRGELSMGTLPDRASMLELLDRLQQPLVLSHGEVSAVVERDHWWGAGVGFVDAHLLASTLASTSVRLWTKDRRLNMLAARYGLNMEEVAAR